MKNKIPERPADALRRRKRLTAAIKLADKVQLRVGCNNLFDKDPPIIGTTDIPAPPVGNGNTFPGYYDSLGRFIFGELVAQF